MSGGDAGSVLGGLAGFAGSGAGQALLGKLGGAEAQQSAQAVALLSKLGLSTEQATMAVPLVLGFLRDRLDPSTLDLILKAAPFLSAFSGDDDGDGGGLGGMLGGLLG